MGGMEGVDSRPRHMVEALGETVGSPCRPRTPSQLSPSPASLPPAFSHQESKFSFGALPGGPSPCCFLSLFPDPGSVRGVLLPRSPQCYPANKIKTYLPLTASIHSADLLLLLGCYKTDAQAVTLISIHLAAGE